WRRGRRWCWWRWWRCGRRRWRRGPRQLTRAGLPTLPAPSFPRRAAPSHSRSPAPSLPRSSAPPAPPAPLLLPLDRCVIGVFSAENPDNATVDGANHDPIEGAHHDNVPARTNVHPDVTCVDQVATPRCSLLGERRRSASFSNPPPSRSHTAPAPRGHIARPPRSHTARAMWITSNPARRARDPDRMARYPAPLPPALPWPVFSHAE